MIADPQVRNRGTIGGDIAHGDPGNDHPALAIALDASFVLRGPEGPPHGGGRRLLPRHLHDRAAEDESPVRDPRAGLRAKARAGPTRSSSARPATGPPPAAAVVMRMSGDKVSHVRIALTNVAPTALRAERRRSGAARTSRSTTPRSQAAADAAIAVCDPAEDLRGDIEYKTAMAGEMVKRALGKACGPLRLTRRRHTHGKETHQRQRQRQGTKKKRSSRAPC